FFFQAEDGIRDGHVTGVQTCALPISSLAAAVFVLSLATFIVILDTTIINVAVPHIAGAFAASTGEGTWAITSYAVAEAFTVPLRSEERRVGKEWRSGWGMYY